MLEMKTGPEWAEELGAHILDPDGWDRRTDEYHTMRVTREDFDRRVRMCTIDMRGYPTFVKPNL